VQRYNSSK